MFFEAEPYHKAVQPSDSRLCPVCPSIVTLQLTWLATMQNPCSRYSHARIQNHDSFQPQPHLIPFIPWHELNVRHRSLTVIAKHPVGHATPPGHLLVPTLTFSLHITL
jgi:hypothetical protein